MEQMATPITQTKPDFGLAQVRLARSVRLSIAMSQRVRESYQDRKAGKAVPQRPPAEEASDVAPAEAAPAEAAPAEAAPRDGEPRRTEPRESLAESECLENELEPFEEAEERRDLDPALLPRDRTGAAAETPDRPPADALPPDPVPGARAEAVSVAARPKRGWPPPSDESGTGRPMPKPWQPDSS
ncbi:hypothetical protein [Inquilinus ginsengisoli]|uniref:hypothetical protein n=1 Tax=Inquilinus ginsengisoli TaxID=363840 RepID=UPI003D211AB9